MESGLPSSINHELSHQVSLDIDRLAQSVTEELEISNPFIKSIFFLIFFLVIYLCSCIYSRKLVTESSNFQRLHYYGLTELEVRVRVFWK